MKRAPAKEKKKRFNELSKSKRKKERNEAKQKETKRNFTNLCIMEHNDDKFTHNEILKNFKKKAEIEKKMKTYLLPCFDCLKHNVVKIYFQRNVLLCIS